MKLPVKFAFLLASCARLLALDAEKIEHSGNRYTVVILDLEKDDLRLFWKNREGKIYRNFDALKQDLSCRGQILEFATNAGMYQEDRKPLGLCVAGGKLLHPINLRKGRGNFYLRPGVFMIDEDGVARILDRRRAVKIRQGLRLATQSGPLLVVDGEIHPIFERDSKSRKIRNGVGVRDDGRIVCAISDGFVNFYEFAELFARRLECRDALFLDGSISRMYAPALKQNDLGGDFGPILGVVTTAQEQ